MVAFDYRQISDSAIRQEYKITIERAARIGNSVSKHYGQGRKPIRFRYVEKQIFNARASVDGDHYLVDINHSVPLFNMILFSKLFSDPAVFTQLETSGQLVSDYELPAVVDPADFAGRADWAIRLNDLRSFAALTLADICNTFVICHEIGHIVSGHIEAGYELDKQSELCELVSFSWSEQDVFDRYQAWEVDADAVAVTLLLNFVQETFDLCETDERLAQMFAGDHRLETVLGVTAAALYAFFCYLKGARDALELQSTHPHPLVRSLFIRDMIVHAAHNRWPVNNEVFLAAFHKHMFEFVDAMEDIALFDTAMMGSDYNDNLTTRVATLPDLRRRFRQSAAPWSWISWDQ